VIQATTLATRGVALPIAAAAASLATGAALASGAPLVGFTPLAAVAALLLISRPAVLLSLFLVSVVLLESDEEGFLPGRAVFYSGFPAPSDFLFGLLVLAVIIELGRRERPPVFPRPFVLPLLLLALALLFGVLNGHFAGAEPAEILPALQALAPLLLLPVVIANLAWDQARDRAVVAAAAALVAFKGIEGMTSWLLEAGRPVGGTTLTFYAPLANFLLLVFLLGVIAALVGRLRLPLWVLAAAPICAAAFVLSYRRNFWIAGILGIAVVLVLGSGLRGRRAALVLILVFVVAVRAIIAVTGAPELEGTVSERLRSLSPTRISADPYDRYRLDEARNVISELRAHPIAGLGLGVPWTATHPLPAELDGGRDYTHVVALWYWLKLGVLGLAAYLSLVAAALVAAVRVSRSHADQYVRIAALAVASGFVALASAETTGSFTGVSYRLTVAVAAILGWLAVTTTRRARASGDAP
jgi:hypothetical protein